MHKVSTASAKPSALIALPSFGLRGVLHEYACGGLGRAQLGAAGFSLAALVRPALSPLRYDTLCIIRAWPGGRLQPQGKALGHRSQMYSEP